MSTGIIALSVRGVLEWLVQEAVRTEEKLLSDTALLVGLGPICSGSISMCVVTLQTSLDHFSKHGAFPSNG